MIDYDYDTYYEVMKQALKTMNKLLDSFETHNEDKAESKSQRCDTCYHNKTEFSICQYCTSGNKYEESEE